MSAVASQALGTENVLIIHHCFCIKAKLSLFSLADALSDGCFFNFKSLHIFKAVICCLLTSLTSEEKGFKCFRKHTDRKQINEFICKWFKHHILEYKCKLSQGLYGFTLADICQIYLNLVGCYKGVHYDIFKSTVIVTTSYHDCDMYFLPLCQIFPDNCSIFCTLSFDSLF